MQFSSTNKNQFSIEQCDAVFAAVLINDVVDQSIHLPDIIHLDYEQNQLIDCFQICREVWEHGVDRCEFDRMIKKLYKERSFNDEEKLTYKHVRAKFKQLRFAYANFDERHQYPMAFNAITTLMGHLQDDFKMGLKQSVGYRSILLRLALSKLPFGLVVRELNKFKPTTVESFRQYVLSEINFIRDSLSKPEVTAREFHKIRKIISRQASFYVALTVLYPSQYHNDVFRYLSAINGMMGRMHDDLVIKESSGEQDYHADRFKMPIEIQERLVAVANSYQFA